MFVLYLFCSAPAVVRGHVQAGQRDAAVGIKEHIPLLGEAAGSWKSFWLLEHQDKSHVGMFVSINN